MEASRRKRKISGKVSQTKKPKVEEVFPINTILQNPGFELISRNIFKYLNYEDLLTCRLVSKFWKQFIDEDNYLANVQLTEFLCIYSRYSKDDTPFQFACKNASFQIIKLFLDNEEKWGIDVQAQDKRGLTPLHLACLLNNSLVVNELMKHGLNVTLRDKTNLLPMLYLAATNKNDPIVIQVLFESKQLMHTDKSITNVDGETVVHFAARNQYSAKPLAYLLENATRFNLNVNQLDNLHQSVFHHACMHGNKKGNGDTVLFLIQNQKKYDIDLNQRNISGYTPIHLACLSGKLTHVEILLRNSKEHNIDVCSKDNNGMDIQAMAELKGHIDVVKLIKDWKNVLVIKERLERLERLEWLKRLERLKGSKYSKA